MPVDSLFFIGNQLVVLSNLGRVAVWQSMTRHWQVQEVVTICSHDRAGSFLLLGCANGSIYHIGELDGWGWGCGGMETDKVASEWAAKHTCMQRWGWRGSRVGWAHSLVWAFPWASLICSSLSSALYGAWRSESSCAAALK